jgi:hypothetical protein
MSFAHAGPGDNFCSMQVCKDFTIYFLCTCIRIDLGQTYVYVGLNVYALSINLAYKFQCTDPPRIDALVI